MTSTQESEGALTPLQLLRADGTLVQGTTVPLTDVEVVEAFRLMLLTRLVDERAVSLQRQGRIGTIASAKGQEAAIVGSAWPLDAGIDWVVPQYRELPALLRVGLPLSRALLYYRGHPVGSAIPHGVNAMPIQISLAAQLPHAVGLAWGLRRMGSDGVVMTYFGEGSASEGDAHESMNLAGIRRAPVIFLLQDNGWAISTPRAKQSAAESLAVRAAGYGFCGELVDGNDLFAMVDATRRAIARAREGVGPTLVEARTYRLGPHNTADDHTRYIEADELAAKAELDPLARLRAYMRRVALLDRASEERMVTELKDEISRAVADMEAVPAPLVDGLFDEAYAVPPQRVMTQRVTALALQGE